MGESERGRPSYYVESVVKLYFRSVHVINISLMPTRRRARLIATVAAAAHVQNWMERPSKKKPTHFSLSSSIYRNWTAAKTFNVRCILTVFFSLLRRSLLFCFHCDPVINGKSFGEKWEITALISISFPGLNLFLTWGGKAATFAAFSSIMKRENRVGNKLESLFMFRFYRNLPE